MSKEKTPDQLEAMKAKAVRFVRDVLDDSDHADEIEVEDPLDYAARKGITVLENPHRRRVHMARKLTRAELEERVEELENEVEALNDKLDSIADIAEGNEEEEDEEEE